MSQKFNKKLSLKIQQESQMAYGTANEALLTVLVMFRHEGLSSFGILAK